MFYFSRGFILTGIKEGVKTAKDFDDQYFLGKALKNSLINVFLSLKCYFKKSGLPIPVVINFLIFSSASVFSL